MSIFKKLFAAISPPSKPDGDVYVVYVHSHRCQEYLSTRIYLNRDLSEQDEEGYIARKVLVGDGQNRCFERVEVVLYFDDAKKLVDREITGGVFVTVEEYEAKAG